MFPATSSILCCPCYILNLILPLPHCSLPHPQSYVAPTTLFHTTSSIVCCSTTSFPATSLILYWPCHIVPCHILNLMLPPLHRSLSHHQYYVAPATSSPAKSLILCCPCHIVRCHIVNLMLPLPHPLSYVAPTTSFPATSLILCCPSHILYHVAPATFVSCHVVFL